MSASFDYIKREFTRLCGEDIAFIEATISARSLVVCFGVAGLDGRYSVYALMPNSTTTALRRAAMLCAKRALEFAYNSTGEREFDIKQLLNGKTGVLRNGCR